MFTHLFEKGKNAPPISKPCLLVISKKRNKAFQGLKTPKNLTRFQDSPKVECWVGAEIGGKKGERSQKKILTIETLMVRE